MSHADDIAGYFGACPVCGRGGRLRHIGRDHWFYCKEHKVKWWGGSNLIRTEKPMTAAEVATTARLTEEGTVDRGYALVRFDGTVSLPLLEMEFRSLADCNAQLRKAAERKRAESKADASGTAGVGLRVE